MFQDHDELWARVVRVVGWYYFMPTVKRESCAPDKPISIHLFPQYNSMWLFCIVNN